MPDPTTVLLRPAIIEIRYIGPEAFNKAADLYEKLLANKTGEVRTGAACTFVIGSSSETDKKDILLRLTYPAKPNVPDNGTILYWEVASTGSGTSQEILRTISGNLASTISSLKVLEPTSNATQLPGSPGKPVAERSLLEDKTAGSLIGVTINPPVPTYTVAPFYPGWAIGGIGVVIGAILALFGVPVWRLMKRRFA